MCGARCECARGQQKCHQMGAVLLHGIRTISSTDKLYTWNRSEAPDSVRLIDELFPAHHFNALQREPTQEDRNYFRAKLKLDGVTCGMRWLLAPEPESAQLPASTWNSPWSRGCENVWGSNWKSCHRDRVVASSQWPFRGITWQQGVGGKVPNEGQRYDGRWSHCRRQFFLSKDSTGKTVIANKAQGRRYFHQVQGHLWSVMLTHAGTHHSPWSNPF